MRLRGFRGALKTIWVIGGKTKWRRSHPRVQSGTSRRYPPILRERATGQRRSTGGERRPSNVLVDVAFDQVPDENQRRGRAYFSDTRLYHAIISARILLNQRVQRTEKTFFGRSRNRLGASRRKRRLQNLLVPPGSGSCELRAAFAREFDQFVIAKRATGTPRRGSPCSVMVDLDRSPSGRVGREIEVEIAIKHVVAGPVEMCGEVVRPRGSTRGARRK